MVEKEKIHWGKVWKFILGMKVELAFFCYFAPGTLNSIGLDLLPIEKVLYDFKKIFKLLKSKQKHKF